MQQTVYLDHSSTTPVDPRVLEVMLPYFSKHFANPSNTSHDLGVAAKDSVAVAREQVAAAIGASPREISFTSGATESNNLALLGACRASRDTHDHVVTVLTEHKSVLEPIQQLAREGFRITCLAVDCRGNFSIEELEQSLTPRTLLVSVMAANNEIGTLAPLPQVAAVCQRHNVIFHCDASQAIGRIPVDVERWGVDLMSLSAHKAYGPKGVGSLYIRRRRRIRMAPLIYGGGQEDGLRSGTLAVPQIVGMGEAFAIAAHNLEAEAVRLSTLRDHLQCELEAMFPEAVVHGHPSVRLPGLLNIGFPGVDGDVMIQLLRGVAVSQGSSCSTGTSQASHVLRAIGVNEPLARASLRLSVGRFTTVAEVQTATQRVAAAVRSAR